MIQDTKQNVYYLTKTGYECHVIEINAQKQKSMHPSHNKIFTLKSESLHGLITFDGSTFFVMDAHKNVLKLQRTQCGSKLIMVDQLVIKEKYRANLKISPFENMIISD